MTNTKRITQVALAVAGTTALTVVPAPAFGQQASHRDAVGDVVLIEDPDSDDPEVVVDEEWANGDITRFRAVHGERRVRVRIGFRDLHEEPGSNRSYLHLVELRTNRTTYQVVGFSPEGASSQDFALVRDDLVRCRGLRGSVDLERDVVRVSVPRACLGRPRWVRAGAATISYVETDVSLTELRVDVSHAVGTADGTAALERIPVGRRLRRG